MPVERHSVLIVEDNPDHALLIRLGLRQARTALVLRMVSSGEEAIRYLSREPPSSDPMRSEPTRYISGATVGIRTKEYGLPTVAAGSRNPGVKIRKSGS